MLALLLLNRMNGRRRISRNETPIKINKNLRNTPGAVYCRTCLTTEDLVSIFYNKDDAEKRSRDLKLVTGLEIKMNDCLSQRMCTRCLERMKHALQFRRTSRRAEKALLGMGSGKPQKKYTKQQSVKTKRPQKVRVKKQDVKKVDKVEMNEFSYEIYGEEFQNDCYEVEVKIEENQQLGKMENTSAQKKKRKVIPNAMSYKCTTCNKEFRMKATYKAHMRFHTNYCVCEACGKRCRNNNQLQEHKRARHGLFKIHKCAFCEYSSATKEALTIHERRHTGERPYVCDHCGATFHRRSNLVQHIAIHLPDKNFQCDMCHKRLKSRKFLQIHKHNAHTGKRYGYLCGICEHRFEKPNKVRLHTRRVHGVPDDQQGSIVRIEL